MLLELWPGFSAVLFSLSSSWCPLDPVRVIAVAAGVPDVIILALLYQRRQGQLILRRGRGSPPKEE